MIKRIKDLIPGDEFIMHTTAYIVREIKDRIYYQIKSNTGGDLYSFGLKNSARIEVIKSEDPCSTKLK